jgi:hypothetical protein
VGIDSLNIDDTNDGERPVHTTLLGSGILIVEHLRGLEQLHAAGFTFTAAPVKVQRIGTFPVRAFASLMRKLHYYLVDVFTDRLFGGNPLAVFTDANGISTALMQSIARELNLSETTFVLPAEMPGTDYRLRIFTPASELPMAGHPTVGTAFVLAREKMITGPLVTFGEGVGLVPVTLSPGLTT